MSKRKPPKEKECHLTMLERDYERLRTLAESQRRSMRNTVVMLLDEALKKVGK